ncbi:MAG TPA: DNA (cytosine-5-)-methyltransferase [Campylobacterales bacterium]|nr:DNA (cytosine-5-)-methyltransferase [Campylobacterales bacterium]
MEQTKFTFIDLFAGIGGFYQGLTKNGGECRAYSEINRDAIETYCLNFSEKKEHNLGDITKIKKLPKHDLLTAGVPCQSWSIAGKNLGFDDDRGQLWNDTIYLLKQSQPKAFIFENVKGLVDPRNKEALGYILKRIRDAGYYADYYVINSYDYGVAQNRVRIYIIGFKEEKFFQKFQLPKVGDKKIKLADILGVEIENFKENNEVGSSRSMSLSSKNGYNDYFLFNDLRNGKTTIHSWDIIETTERQKEICYLLLKNRRKSAYGKLDGNPLSLEHFCSLDKTTNKHELDELVELGIFKKVAYVYRISSLKNRELSENEHLILNKSNRGNLVLDELKSDKGLKLSRVSILKTLESLKEKKILEVIEFRYEFKNSKISTGLFGVNRIFLPNADTFPTLVASDTNDYITLKHITPTCEKSYRERFLQEVYRSNNYRKITKEEACLIQGFPKEFKLPTSRSRWMKLIGNSVSVPVIEVLCRAILETGVFESEGIKENYCEKRSA